MTKGYLSEKHSIHFLLVSLRTGSLQARGLAGPLYQKGQLGYQDEPVIIPTSFWKAFDRRRYGLPSNWHYSYLEATVGLTDEPYAYRDIELDWQAVEMRLQDDLFEPPYFRDVPHQRDDSDFDDDWLAESAHAMMHPQGTSQGINEEAREENSVGRPRASEWNNWVAELAYRVKQGDVTGRSNVSTLIRTLMIHLEKRGLRPPPTGTVRDAASAVLDRLSPEGD